MKITHVITKGDVGGAQTHVVELAIAQRRRVDDVSIIAGLDGPAMDRARAGDVPVTILDSIGHALSVREDPAAVKMLRSHLRELRPDIVHAHSSKAGVLARIAARLEKIPSVYTAHGFPFQREAPLLQRSQSLVGEFTAGHVGSAVICLTDAEADLARRWHIAKPTAIFVVPNGLPDTSFVRTPTAADAAIDSGPRMVMVARFAPPKRQADLIAALSRLLDIPWSMTFIGDGPEFESCRRRGVDALGNRVQFLGHRDDVEPLLAAHDIALLWSKYEGMPLSLLEAMRAGLACVASDLPGVHRLYGAPAAGLVASTPRDLERHLRSVLVDDALRTSLGRSARRRFVAEFTIDKMVQRVAEIYDVVVADIGD